MKLLSKPSNPDVSHIIHIADIHVRTGDKKHSRSEEYIHVFKNFINNISELDCVKNGTAITLIAGDLFHNKGRFETEGATIMFEFINNLLNLTPVLIIAGNHDFRQEDPTYRDTIEMLVQPYKNDSFKNPIHYLRYTDHYVWRNIGIGVCSVKDTLREYNTAGMVDELPAFPDPSIFTNVTRKVALFHGSISQSALPNGRTIDSITRGYPLEWFKGYDFAVLGDNHKQQLNLGLDNTLLWSYPGSLIQQDDGEPLFGHGYTLWDVQNNTATTHDVLNSFGSVTIIRNSLTDFQVRLSSKEILPLDKVLMNPKFPKFPKLRMVACGEHFSNIKEYLNSFGIEPSSLKMVKTIGQAKDDDPVVVNDETGITDVNSPQQWDEFIHALDPSLNVSEWIHDPKKILMNSDVKLPRTIVDTVLRRNADIQKALDAYDATVQSVEKRRYNVTLKSMEWSYIMCYGKDNYLNFETLENSIALLNGANASGKSSFLDVLCIGLFGEPTTSRVETGEVKQSGSVIHEDKPRDSAANVTIVISVEQDEYIIHRAYGIAAGDKKQVLGAKVFKVVPNDSTMQLVAEGKQTVDAWITKRLGTMQDMLMSSVLCQMDNTSFFYLNSNDQKAILDKAVNLHTIASYQTILDESIKSHKAVVREIDIYMNGMRARSTESKTTLSNTELKANLEAARKEYERSSKRVEAISEKIKSLYQKIGVLTESEKTTALNTSVVDIQEELVAVDDAAAKETDYDNLKTALVQLSSEKCAIETELEQLQDVCNVNSSDIIRQCDVDEHLSIRPHESKVTDVYIVDKKAQFKAWCTMNKDLMRNPTDVNTSLERSVKEQSVLMNTLEKLNMSPVAPAKLSKADGDKLIGTSVDTSVEEIRQDLQTAHAVLDKHMASIPQKVRSRSALNAIVKEFATWRSLYPAEWTIDSIKTQLAIKKKQLATLEQAYDDLIQSAVTKPSKASKPLNGSLSVHAPVNYKDTKDIKDKIASTQGKIDELRTPITPSRPKSGYVVWQKEQALWQTFQDRVPMESSKVLKVWRDLALQSVNNLNQIDRIQKDIDELAAIPFNDNCWACKQHHGPSQDSLIRKRETVANLKDETAKCSVSMLETDLTVEGYKQMADGLTALIEVREEYERKVDSMSSEEHEWESSKLCWQRESVRVETLLEQESFLTTLMWGQYEQWSCEVADVKKNLAATRTTVEKMSRFCDDSPHKQETVNDAEKELELCSMWEEWESEFNILNARVQKCEWMLWMAWSQAHKTTSDALATVNVLISKLQRFVQEYDSWCGENIALDIESKKLVVFSEWETKYILLQKKFRKRVLGDKLDLTNRQYNDIKERLAKIERCEMLKKQLNIHELVDLEHDLKEQLLHQKSANGDTIRLAGEIKEAEEDSDAQKDIALERTIINARYERLERFRDVFIGKKSTDGFKATIYRERVIPLIVTNMNQFLVEIIDDFRFNVIMTGGKLIYSVVDRGNTIVLGNCSGFQKFIVGLAMRAVLAKIGAVGQSLRHIIIDEGFVCCDSSNIQKSHSILIELMRTGKYKSIIMMSHLEAIREISQKMVNIERDSGRFSYIRYGAKRQKLPVVSASGTSGSTSSPVPKARGRPKKQI
jgi:DNA repair exonuclease SbcCD ATPase subunit/DNA repair exonuclease SbcCD nuclease subunit